MNEMIKLPTRYDEQWRAIRDADSNHVVRLAFTAEDSVGPHIAHVLNTHDALVAAAKDVVNSYNGEGYSEDIDVALKTPIERLEAALTFV